MAIDATTLDSSAAQRTVQRERAPSPVINDGHNGGPVEIKGEMSFWDVLDVINPLQHIPIVSTIYRNLTGDTIQPAARVIGGILYGGPLGGMASIANAVVEEAKGQDFGDQILASLGFGEGAHPTAPVAVATGPGDTAKAASPGEPAAAIGVAKAAEAPAAAAGQPIRLGAPAAAGAAATAAAAGTTTTPAASLAAQLAGGPAHGAMPGAGKMPPRDTPLASSTMVKHAVPKFAAPLPGSIPVSAQTSAGAGPNAAPSTNQAANANPAPPANANAAAAPEALSETMMRNLAKYEQSRRAVQSATPAMRVSS